jgi:hypothetical protein
LVYSEVLEKTNYSTISKLFDKSIGLIGVQHDNVLLFKFDAASYMVKAANSLKVLYCKMVHITCTAHRVAEKVRGKFSTVDKVISSFKKTFQKASNPRTPNQIFRNEAPNLNLAPEPVITRWGTWINASNYYCENLGIIHKIIEKLDADNAIGIKEAQKYKSKDGIERDLAYIKSNFSILTVSITKLQEKKPSLADALNIFENLERAFENLQGSIGKAILTKFKNVVSKNIDLKILKNISNVLSSHQRNTELEFRLPEDLLTDDLVYFKHASIISVDVKR